MNERINELAGKAVEFSVGETKAGNAPRTSGSLLYREKFAELIILQCISIAEETVGNAEGVTFGLGEDIKRYFGIEAVE